MYTNNITREEIVKSNVADLLLLGLCYPDDFYGDDFYGDESYGSDFDQFVADAYDSSNSSDSNSDENESDENESDENESDDSTRRSNNLEELNIVNTPEKKDASTQTEKKFSFFEFIKSFFFKY